MIAAAPIVMPRTKLNINDMSAYLPMLHWSKMKRAGLVKVGRFIPKPARKGKNEMYVQKCRHETARI